MIFSLKAVYLLLYSDKLCVRLSTTTKAKVNKNK